MKQSLASGGQKMAWNDWNCLSDFKQYGRKQLYCLFSQLLTSISSLTFFLPSFAAKSLRRSFFNQSFYCHFKRCVARLFRPFLSKLVTHSIGSRCSLESRLLLSRKNTSDRYSFLLYFWGNLVRPSINYQEEWWTISVRLDRRRKAKRGKLSPGTFRFGMRDAALSLRTVVAFPRLFLIAFHFYQPSVFFRRFFSRIFQSVRFLPLVSLVLFCLDAAAAVLRALSFLSRPRQS